MMEKTWRLVKICAAFALGFAVQPVFQSFINNFTTNAIVWQQTYCSGDDGSCIYARFEQTTGIKYYTDVFFFSTEHAAQRGLISHRRVRCTDVGVIMVKWLDASSFTVSDTYGGCQTEGYRGQTAFAVEEIRDDETVVHLSKAY